MDAVIGLALSALIAGLAYVRGSLNASGLLAALGLGTMVYALAGAGLFWVLMIFFISSSLLARLHPTRLKTRRSAWQVLANGGVLVLLIVMSLVWDTAIMHSLMLTSIGVAMSDTWSSEIGQKSRVLPFHVLTKKPMTPGLSGGVSVLGFAAAACAGMVIAMLSYLVLDAPSLRMAFIIGLFSFLGAWLDSILGLLQVKYHALDGALTEDPQQGALTTHGWPWLDNNLVNFLANAMTVIVLGLLLHFL
ncbi:MAG: DUF92 domain-containing protein [Acholeplasmatales bacterium]|nr:MAG: DUF92 domain-containing protein [Acholeplasmatales bacterium]